MDDKIKKEALMNKIQAEASEAIYNAMRNATADIGKKYALKDGVDQIEMLTRLLEATSAASAEVFHSFHKSFLAALRMVGSKISPEEEKELEEKFIKDTKSSFCQHLDISFNKGVDSLAIIINKIKEAMTSSDPKKAVEKLAKDMGFSVEQITVSDEGEVKKEPDGETATPKSSIIDFKPKNGKKDPA